MGVFWPPVTTEWKALSKRQGWILLVAGLILELPIRWIIRPDIPYLRPGNPWFSLPLRFGLELAMVLFFVAVAFAIRSPLRAVGFPRRKWTRWEWGTLAIIGGIQLIVVALLVGGRWIRIWDAGLIVPGLLWAGSEFLFGFNQETGFRGMIMTGMLPLARAKWAYIVNTLFFLVGPIHGPGLVTQLAEHPGAGLGYAAGVIVHGVAYSWIRHRSDNIVLCGALHGIINGFMNGAAFVLRANQMM